MPSPQASTSSGGFRNAATHDDSDDDSDGDAAFREARTDTHDSSDNGDDSHDEQDDAEDWHDPSELAVSSPPSKVDCSITKLGIHRT